MKLVIKNIIISIYKDQDIELKKEIENKGIDTENILNISYKKRSIDSRKKSDIKFVYNIEVTLKKEIDISNLKNVEIVQVEERKEKIKRKGISEVAIVGTGPAGLFAALRLCELGIKPTLYERGKEIDERDKSIEEFIKNEILDENSNIQFGEGGAGTYSDGKLNTGVRSEYMEKIFSELVSCGAQEKILWDYKPHIGTDVLKIVIKNLRKKIIAMGGEFKFNTLVKDIIIENNIVKGITICEIDKINSECNEEKNIACDHVILAIGHSSRSTYEMLHKRGVLLESKPFAVGVRIENPREDIDFMQYGKEKNNETLGAATYSLTYNNKEENRGTFSFCMCPGGVIVNASSEKNRTLVNGMSYSKRDGKFSNSAIVVGVKPEDFGNDIFAGMDFQKKLEENAYNIIGGHGALFQKTKDFLNNKTSSSTKIDSSYEMKLKSYNFNDFFPEFISSNLKNALKHWEKTQKNFINENSNLIGPETRTSSPVKITRNEFGESVNTKGLYPIGEGAGYAGGITSAAIDGIKIVDLSFTE